MHDDNNLTKGERNTLLNMADDCSAIAEDPGELAVIQSYRYLIKRELSVQDAYDATTMMRRTIGKLKAKGPAPGRVGSVPRRV